MTIGENVKEMARFLNSRVKFLLKFVMTGTMCLFFWLLKRFPVSNVGHENSSRENDENMAESVFLINSKTLPKDDAFNPTVANGYVGYRIFSDTIYMNGLYNGAGGDSHRARIEGTLPHFDATKISISSEFEKFPRSHKIDIDYTQDMKNGTFAEKCSLMDKKSKTEICTIIQTWYAHRKINRLLVTEIKIDMKISGTLTIPLVSTHGNGSADLQYEQVENFQEATLKEPSLTQYGIRCGSTVTPEESTSEAQNVCIVSTKFGQEIIVQAEEEKTVTYTFMTSIATRKEETMKYYYAGLDMERKEMLFITHSNDWHGIWKDASIILLGGDQFQSQSILSGLYYLASVFPSSSLLEYPYRFSGVSPGGLTKGRVGEDCYLGHVFWDQEFWILPSLLPFYPKAVKEALIYRVRKLDAARKNAKKYGYEGAMYPWESAHTGSDVCPGEKYRMYENHVTGDIVHAVKQYVYLTGDWEFMDEPIATDSEEYYTPWDMLYETALYWTSRVSWDENRNGYIINDVMGPDEYHSPVNNSAFTNVVASQNLKFVIKAAEELGKKIPKRDEMMLIAQKLIVPFDKVKQYHPEYDGFNPSTDEVKQADTIMLGFPLMYSGMTPETRKNDLILYEKITDRQGPAMTWSMFAVNWLKLDEYERAEKLFLRQYDNIQKPFLIWSEVTHGEGAVNFLTGIGGYLQSISYGYLGLRIYKNSITLKPCLPPTSNKSKNERLIISGFKYQNFVLNITVGADEYEIKLAKFTSAKYLEFVVTSGKEKVTFKKIGDKINLPARKKCSLRLQQ